MTLLVVWAIGAIFITAMQLGAGSTLARRRGHRWSFRAHALLVLIALTWPLSSLIIIAVAVGRVIGKHVKDDQ